MSNFEDKTLGRTISILMLSDWAHISKYSDIIEGGGGSKEQKNAEIMLYVPTLLATIVAPI